MSQPARASAPLSALLSRGRRSAALARSRLGPGRSSAREHVLARVRVVGRGRCRRRGRDVGAGACVGTWAIGVAGMPGVGVAQPLRARATNSASGSR